MLVLIIGLVLFLGVHSVCFALPHWRAAALEKLGANGWKAMFSLISVVGLVLIVIGYGIARQDPIFVWSPPPFTRHLAALIMLPVFPLLLATYLPGKISARLKHPMLIAVKAWALAHLLANGMLADVVLFGSFLAWAVADRISFKRRSAKDIPQLPSSRANDAIALGGGLLIYIVFALWLHEPLIGVRPF